MRFQWRNQFWQSLEEGQTQSTGLRLHSPTTAIVDYAIGLEKLSANEQFFDDTQMAASF